MRIGLALAIMAAALAAPAHAGPLDGLGTCTLTLNAPGKLVMGGDGTTLGTQNGDGTGAVMAIVGLNLTPKLTFSPLTLIGPTGWSGTTTAYLSATTGSGRSQPYTTGPFSLQPNAVLDSVTLNARFVSDGGFKAGSYNASTTITCESA